MNWINCEDKMPEEGKMVLVTIWGSDLIVQKEGETLVEALNRIWEEVRYVSTGRYYGEKEGWVGADGYPMIVFPVAWMPMPEPYQGEQE